MKKGFIALVLAAPFLVGLTYTWGIALYAAVGCLFLIYRKYSDGSISIGTDSSAVALVVMLAGALVTVFAVSSHGDAFTGFFRLASYAVFALVVTNTDRDTRQTAVSMLPYSAAVMTVISAAAFFTDARSVFFETHRLAGFFQYSNTMALFLLLCTVILFEKKSSFKNTLLLVIITAGLLWTGSRLTYLMALAVAVYEIVKQKRKASSCLYLVVLAVIPVLALLAERGAFSFGRITTLSLSSSTVLGRLLYWKDAVPVILRHPLGLGYQGYYHIETVIQHGVYSVRNVHNCYLQMALDYGWIPLAALIFLIVKGVTKLDGSVRLMLLITACHSFADFDLEYGAVVLILILILSEAGSASLVKVNSQKEIKSAALTVAIPAAMAAVSVWLTVGNALWAAGLYEQSYACVPFSSDTMESIMMNTASVERSEEMALKLTRAYPEFATAYGALADARSSRISQGTYQDAESLIDDIEQLMSYKWLSVKYAPYHQKTVNEFDALLDELGQVDSGDIPEEAAEYKKRLKKLMSDTKAGTDPLAYRLRDKPFTVND